MNKKRIVSVKSNCFDLTFTYNRKLFTSLSVLWIIITLLLFFIQGKNLRIMLFTFLCIVLIITVILLFYGLSVDVRDADNKEIKNTKDTIKKTDNISEVGNHTKKEKAVKEVNSTIKNKVPIPNPQPNKQVTSSVESKTPTIQPKTIPIEEMTEEAWDDVFSLDDDFFG